VPEESKTPEVPITDDLPVRRSENFVKVYSNNTGILGTPFDFVLTFGEVIRSPEASYIEQTVSVTMSPQHVKALAVLVLNNIKEYEKHVGKIPLQMKDIPEPESGEATPGSSKRP
jgi:hypothetical protein